MGEVAEAALAGAHPGARLRGAVAVGALGVVFGDIGTSPLYAFKEAAKAAGGGGAPTPEAVLGVAVADPLGADPGRLAQIRRPHPARRQPRRGRDRGPAGAARRARRGARELAGVAAGRGPDRGGAALRRRRDHAGDLGPERRRGAEGRRAACSGRWCCRSRWSSWWRSSSCSGAGPGFIGAHLRPGDAGLVRGARPPGLARHRAGAGRAGGRQPDLRPVLPAPRQPGRRASRCSGAVFLAVTGGEAMYADMGHFGAAPSGSPGSRSCCPASCSTTSARARCC